MGRLTQLNWGIAMLVVVMLTGALLTGIRQAGALDRWWYGVMEELRAPVPVALARGLDWLGGGVVGVYVVPASIGAAVLLVRGWRSAAFAVVAFALSAAAVQAAKHVLGRVRPEDLLVAVDHGSFPSGHTANAATIAVVLWLLFPRAVTAVLGGAWVLLMGLSRTVLAVHWLTDVAGGALIGSAMALLVAALLLPRVSAELEENFFRPVRDESRRRSVLRVSEILSCTTGAALHP